MLIDERISELTEDGAKMLLRRAVEDIADRLSCEACVMRAVCGKEASGDDCMRQVLVMLAVPRAEDDDADQDDEPKEATILYDPKTMQIEE